MVHSPTPEALGLQDCPDAHGVPQLPQLLGSVVVSTQLLPQIVMAARNRQQI